LDYSEDSVADVDFNVVQTESGQYVELQGTAEHHTFSNPQLLDLLTVAGEGIQQIVGFQKSVLGIV
jgi:ribonuclease PH